MITAARRQFVTATAVAAAGLAALMAVDAFPADPADLFDVSAFTETEKVRLLSERVEAGVSISELLIPGPPVAGKPTTIYAIYARPLAVGRYPGVVQVHGAGPGPLNSVAASYYAQNGFCCVSIDWWGKGPAGQGRRITSDFEWNGSQSSALERDLARHGVLFVRRAFQFLKSREEVDDGKLCLSGMSAGAHLALLVLGCEPSIKAAAVKYGCGFIKELGEGSLWFKPILSCPADVQDAWLSVFDPKNGLKNYKASVLILSGTDDVWFAMPAVLATWRAIPTDKRLVMLPNDNHSRVGNETLPLRYFKSIFKLAPPFPELQKPEVVLRDGLVRLSCRASTFSKVSTAVWCVKRMRKGEFRFGQTPEATWEELPATLDGDAYEAMLATPSEDEQLVAYLLLKDESGAESSSDTVEVPDYPAWRAAQ
jgi:dienelactone hydrolase